MKRVRPGDIDINLEPDDAVPTLEKSMAYDYDKIKKKIDDADTDGWFKRKFPTKKKRLLAGISVALVVVLMLGAFNKYILGI